MRTIEAETPIPIALETEVVVARVGQVPSTRRRTGKDQFKGLVEGIKVAKNSADHDNNEILALTGATITSNAVTTAVNEALANYKTITENGGAN